MAERRGRLGPRAAHERGAVTAELAVGLPAVVLVLAVLLATAGAAAVQLRCADGARAGARVAALGEGDAAVASVARRVAGGGARVAVDRDPSWVTVTVTASGPASWIGAAPVAAASATAWVEP